MLWEHETQVSVSTGKQGTTRGKEKIFLGQKIFSLPRVVPCFPLLGLTPSGLFMVQLALKFTLQS